MVWVARRKITYWHIFSTPFQKQFRSDFVLLIYHILHVQDQILLSIRVLIVALVVLVQAHVALVQAPVALAQALVALVQVHPP